MNQLAPVRLSPTASAEGFTTDQFMDLLATGVFDFAGKVELVNGAIIKMAPAHAEHSFANGSVAFSLMKALADRPVSVAIDLAVETDAQTLRGIDIAVVRTGAPRQGVVPSGFVELAVEIADTTLSNDLVVKAAEYATASIDHYWVVDIKARVVHVMSDPETGTYIERSVVRFGEPLAVPGTTETIIVE